MSHDWWKNGSYTFFRKPFFIVGLLLYDWAIKNMKAEELSKQFPGKLAVSQLNFEILPGKLTALLGPNGAGKTTTMRLLSGFVTPSTGQVLYEGRDLQTFRREIQQQIGYLPENGPAYKDLTVLESLEYVARARGIQPYNLTRFISTVLEEMDLGGVRGIVTGTLSKGFKQRVALACVLLGKPKYLILDEPSYGLDPKQMGQIRQLIKNLSKERTVMLSTHSLDEVEEICDHVIILSKGKIVANSSVQEIRKQDKITLEVKDANIDFVDILSRDNWLKVKKIRIMDQGFTEYEVSTDNRKPEELYLYLSKSSILIREMRKQDASLKAIFTSITSN